MLHKCTLINKYKSIYTKCTWHLFNVFLSARFLRSSIYVIHYQTDRQADLFTSLHFQLTIIDFSQIGSYFSIIIQVLI